MNRFGGTGQEMQRIRVIIGDGCTCFLNRKTVITVQRCGERTELDYVGAAVTDFWMYF